MELQETLQKTLADFQQKEELISAERIAVEEQIGQLETRLEHCQQRLGTIAADRERVESMKERYVGFLDVPVKTVAEQSPKPIKVPKEKAQTASAKPPVAEPDQPADQTTKPVEPVSAEAATQVKSDSQEKKTTEGEADTVKSINEALRSLFH